MWKIWLDLEAELKEREEFHPITELLSSRQAAAAILCEVPLLPLPPNAPGATYVTADVPGLVAPQSNPQPSVLPSMPHPSHPVVAVPPVHYQNTVAMLESSRMADSCVRKEVVIATRMPDLM